MCRLLLPLLLALAAAPAPAAQTALELELGNATPGGTPLMISGDVGGACVAWTPYIRTGRKGSGRLAFHKAQGTIELTDGRLGGTLTVAVPGSGKNREPVEGEPMAYAITATIADAMVTGTWTRGEVTGPIRGIAQSVADPMSLTAGSVTLDRAYPWPGREGSDGYNGLQTRLGAAFTLEQGKVTAGTTGPNAPKASWYPGRSYTPSPWVLPNGQRVQFAGAGYAHQDTSVTGDVEGDTLTLQLKAIIERQPVPVLWDMTLTRYGRLWVGDWAWTVPEGTKDISFQAAGRVGNPQRGLVGPAEGDDGPRAKLLRHAIALANHPGAIVFRDDILAGSAKGTGNKQYDNPPNNVHAAITAGLLLHELAEDPYTKAEGLAMARRGAYWWKQQRRGPLRIAGYYKGMFWVTAWAGLGLAELTAHDPGGPWAGWSAELANSLVEAQLESGAWTWVDEDTGKKGTSNERNDRSKDNRHLNCGDVLLALSRLSAATGTDTAAAQAKADAFLTKAMADPPEWFYLDRRPGGTLEPFGTVAYLQWLAEQPQRDDAKIAKVKQVIEAQFLDAETGLLRGYLPRWTPNDARGRHDLAVSARYAHTLARLGGDGRAQARNIVDAILAQASPETGLIDQVGRNLPADPEALAHAYLCLKAAIGRELLETVKLLEAIDR